MVLSDLSQGCSNKSDTVMINKNVTRLTTQGYNNTAISSLYRTCWNNLVTSLIISTRLLQIVTSSAKTTCWQTCYKIWDFCVCTRKNLTTCQQDMSATCLQQACQHTSCNNAIILSSCYMVVTRNLLTNCWIAGRCNKLLEQLVTSLLSITTF